jgi:hypothetical protein
VGERASEVERRPLTSSPLVATVTVIAIYLVAAIIVYWSVWSANPTVTTQVGPDASLNMWFLAWAPHALAHGLNPLFASAGNSPYGINVLNNTSELLLGTLMAPVTVLWGPVATFNVLMTLALAGSATSAYFLARRFTGWRPAAFAAGLLFGFSPYMIAQSAGTHLHLTFMVVPPLILLVLHEMLVRQRWRASVSGLALAGLVVAQFFISVEVLVTTAVTALVAVVVLAVIGRHAVAARLPYVMRSAALAIGVSAVVLAYPIWFLVLGPGHIRGEFQLLPEAYRADLFGLFVPDLHQALAPARAVRTANHFANSYTENGSYLGVPLVLALGLGALWLRRRAEVWVMVVSGAAMFVLSLGGALAIYHAPALNAAGGAAGRLPLPEDILSKLPVLDNTVPVRFSVYVVLFAGLLLALVLDELHRRWGGRLRQSGIPAVLAAVCFVPLIPAVPLDGTAPLAIPPYFAGRAVTALAPGSVTIVTPYPSETFSATQMWQVSGSHPFRFDLAGGYYLVARDDAGHQVAQEPVLGYTLDTLTARVFVGLALGRSPRQTASLRAEMLRQFHRWKVANVVVPLAYTPNAAATVAFFTWLLGKPTDLDVSGATVWYRI